MKSSNLVAIVLACLLVSSTLADINYDFLVAANNMIGQDVDTTGLLSGITTNASFDSKDDYSGNVDGLADSCTEYNFDVMGSAMSFKVCPYTRVRPLKFSQSSRLQSLTFQNNVVSYYASVTANGLVAVRNGNTIQLRQATGSSYSSIPPQYTSQVQRVCKKSLFSTKCHDEVVQVARGLQHWEIEKITSKMQREAAIALKNEIAAKTGLGAIVPLTSLGSLYLQESNQMRQLYTELEYDYSEIANVNNWDLISTIQTATLNLVTDGWIHSRITEIANSAYHSCFLSAPVDNYLFVIGVINQGGVFTVRISTFKISGRLPVGAFATSSGTWNLERYGEGASPSIHQVISIFPALKG